jgi:hypothetical protein
MSSRFHSNIISDIFSNIHSSYSFSNNAWLLGQLTQQYYSGFWKDVGGKRLDNNNGKVKEEVLHIILVASYFIQDVGTLFCVFLFFTLLLNKHVKFLYQCLSYCSSIREWIILCFLHGLYLSYIIRFQCGQILCHMV